MDEPSALGQPVGTPFSPHFGGTPNTLVGRGDLLGALGSGLASGPDDKWYTTIVMGVRGSGKTTVLNEIEDRAALDGWVVLSLDAGTPGVLDRIAQAIGQASRSYESLGLREAATGRSVGKSLGIRLGPLEGKLEATDFFNSPEMGLREHLTYLVHQAMKQNASVLLTVDELHGIGRLEGRRLSNDIQHITRRAKLPLAFVGAGLLEMRHTLMRDRKMTFFHRCEDYELPPLDVVDAMKGLAAPIGSVGGSILPDALSLAASSVNGSPYRLQVIGDAAWRLSDAPHAPIDTRIVEMAAAAADGIVEKNIAMPAWHDLSEREKSVLVSLADRSGKASATNVALDVGISGNQASGVLARLRDSGYLTSPSAGNYELSGLVPSELILQVRHEVESSRPISGPAASGRGTAPPCRKWMPRARAYCGLKAGHAGGCRSR